MGPGVVTLAGELAPLLVRPWLLVGVGSDLRGDDAFGPLLARRLVAGGLPAIDAGTAPESYTGPILRAGAELLLFADTGDLQAPAGTLRLVEPGAAVPGGTSTHDASLTLLIAYLTAQRPFAVRLLVAQPKGKGLGNAVSSEVEAAVDLAAAAVCEASGRGASARPRI
jgi:hydrogenase 3 maturation protease